MWRIRGENCAWFLNPSLERLTRLKKAPYFAAHLPAFLEIDLG
jgi:hypothetical protein